MNTIDLMHLLHSISDPVVRLDGLGQSMSMNLKAEQIFIRLGCDPVKVIGHTVWDVFPDLKGTRAENELRRPLEDDVPFKYEFYYAEHERWYEAQGFPSSPGVVLIFRDITDVKAGQCNSLSPSCLLS